MENNQTKKTYTPYDQAFKKLFADPLLIASLLADFADDRIVNSLDLATLTHVSGEFISDNLSVRRCDMVWRVNWKDGSPCYLALLLEFQSSDDYWMPLRIAEYSVMLIRQLIENDKIKPGSEPPAVLPIVLYTGDALWTAPLRVEDLYSHRPDWMHRYILKQDYLLIDEQRISDEELSHMHGLFAILMRFTNATTPEHAREIFDWAKETLTKPEYVHLVEPISIIFSWSAYKHFAPGAAVPDIKNLAEVDTMFNNTASAWVESQFQRGWQAGEARGATIGEARGATIGEARGLRFSISNYLGFRFGSLPTQISEQLASIADVESLRNLLNCAYHAESLQEFSEKVASAK